MVRVARDLYDFLVLFLPWKVVLALGVVVALATLPAWLETLRERQLRGHVRRMVRAEQTERAALVEDTFALAGERASRLARLVEAGRHYDQRDVVARALERLAAVDATEAERLRRQAEIVRPKVRDALEAAVRVESLAASGLTDRAREVLAEALRDHPADPELLALRDRLRDG